MPEPRTHFRTSWPAKEFRRPDEQPNVGREHHHVVMGTDYPFPWNTAPVDHILSIPGISDADKIAMLGGTAAKLLGIDS